MQRKILMLSTSLGLGGADREVIRLASNLLKRGYLVKMIAMVPLGAMGEEAKSRGIDVASLNMKPGMPDIRVVPQLAQLIKTWCPNILHSHMVHANILARSVRIFNPQLPALVSTIQNINDSQGQKWREFAYKATDFLCDATTNVSKAGVERYLKAGLVSPGKIKFIPNSVDEEKFRPDAHLRSITRQSLNLKDQFVWLAVGRFHEQKDYPNMLKAFASGLFEVPNATLLIAGEGKLQPEMIELCNMLNIAAQVRFLGPRHDVPELMNAADAYVLSSAWEGMPLVVLEAASTGLPVVATDVGGVSETILPNQTGFLVPPQDSDALAVAMQKMMELPEEQRSDMGKQGREFIVNYYSAESITNQWEKLYCELLDKAHVNV